MMRKLRWLILGMLASAGAGLLTLASAMNEAFLVSCRLHG